MAGVTVEMGKVLSDIDTEKEFMVLSKFRCGRVELIKLPFVPDKAIGRALSSDFAGKNCLELHLEDEG